MASKGFFNAFADVWMHEGVRTPMVDYCGALGHISPTDLGIKAAREALKRAGIAPTDIGSVITGNMAPGDFDQFFLPRHIGLYAGVPQEVPAIMTQRICGTGFELFRQAGEQIEAGVCDTALVVGTESMTRNPIAAFDHRTGFKLGAPVGFKDYMWEALKDPAAGINMIQTAENLAKKYNITREEVDQFASDSFAKAVAAQEAGFHAGEIVPVVTEKFELEGYKARGIKLQGKVTEVSADTHARISPVEVLAKLKPVYEGGVQTGGNSAALVDAAAACVVTWFTFLPSFIFILAGGPLVESSRHVPTLTGPLQAISAAVIGVMLQLAGTFAWHTVWPTGQWTQADWPALALTALAAWLLIARQWPVMRVLAVCVVVGMGVQWV